MFDLVTFSLSDMVRCGARLRRLGDEAASLDEAARSMVDYLRDNLVDPVTGEPECVLARLFVSRRYADLTPEAQRVADEQLPAGPTDGDLRCLNLIATRGDTPEWDDLTLSRHHLAIPMTSAEAVTRAPMLRALISHLGLDVEATVRGDERAHGDRFDVFHVPDATGSPLSGLPRGSSPADHGARSVLGFGGTLPGGEIFALVLFSRVPVSTETARMFRSVAVSVRLGLLGHLDDASTGAGSAREQALTELLEVLETSAQQQAAHLENLVTDLSETQRVLRDQEHRLREETSVVETLHEVGRTLAAELDLQVIVQRACDAATTLTGAAFGSFFYNVEDMSGESYLLYVLSGVPRETFARFPMPRNTQVFDHTFRGLGILRLDDVKQDARYGRNAPYHGMPQGHLDVRSYLAVPVISPSGKVLGGFFFGHPQTGMFTARHERLAAGVAAQAAVAMDNARLYQQQRDAAVELQRTLLPPLQEADGLTTAWRYLPAAQGTEVGGDWVDLVPLGDGRTAFVVGDVMGKGIQAAAVMGQMRTAVRAYAIMGLPPGQMLRRLDALLGDVDTKRLVTCTFAVHDPVARTLTIANAGHLPPLLRGPDGETRHADGKIGPPLGVVCFDYEEETVPFPAGSQLLLYTDGLVERRNELIDNGMATLARAWGSVEDPSAAEALCEHLLSECIGARGHDDDIALLYVRSEPGRGAC
ncbi:GAF domain-containing protein [Sphaerisporangium album]|uniref:protein-serine/threonine phosphatase n=1 Tax=Sphaerisporangium album TaxID=509200 RepID=A0A367FIY8_9ACTN|nr:SpoIIE family protein phosphatase [Sphaerisporangium album]RCG30363.1 GAF domain-containing protein [Sphaerisporangium album]